MLSKRRKAVRLSARWHVLEDVTEIISALSGGGIIQFRYLSNKYATDLDKKEYKLAMNNLMLKLSKEADKLWLEILKLESETRESEVKT